MRLLEYDNDGEFRLTEIFDNIPPYAILSHTWGLEEITFGEMIERTGTSKAGFDKIQFCAQQARRDGLRYFWVDTCCIDKSNHTELHEAINSMFRWYHKAARCYVYLSDVSIAGRKRKRTSKQSELSWETAFRASRWFTRGWTLQELLAPASVEFFSREGQQLGDKRSLEQQIHEITGIAVPALQGADLSQFNVEERFKWAETRQTTREEDRTYCLLGIFGVFMPLIYGEGRENAARRLRQEIDSALNRELRFFLDKLPRADGAAFDSQAEGASATCHPDTRVNLLRQIHEWTDQPQAEAIFWLNGMAGTGKSTICRTVARHFADSRRLGASFFFKRGDGDRGKVTKFFTTIAAQLVWAVPAVAVHVKNAIESDPAVVGKAMREQFEKLVLSPLSEISLGGSQALVMVIDALDECERDDHVKLLINLFSSAKSLTSLRLRILVTSRPELPIRLGFSAIQGRYKDLVLHEIPEPDIKHDISAYLTSELVRIRDEYNSSVPKDRRLVANWPGNSTIQILVKMAVPLFIFAATVCRFLADRRCGNPDKQLRKVLDYQTRSQESKLDATYLPVLNQLLIALSTREREQVIERFRVIVGSIVILANPLSSHSLAQMLAISKDTVDDTLDLLHSVLSVPSSSHSTVRLLHLSFRDFLLNPETRESNPFWIDERQTHMQLAAHCVRVMSEHLRTDICGLQMPGIRRSAINPKIIDNNLPLEVQYACVFWVYHAKQSSIRIHDGDQFHDFLGRHFLQWLEALGLIGRATEGITIIRSLQSLVEHRSNPEVSDFLNDAVRLILANTFVIDSAPLQVYSSVLAFTPQKSIIRKTFENEVPDWISLLPEAETNWSQCLQILEGHDEGVYSVGFSHDSALVASASWDGTVRIWCTDTGECLQTLECNNSGVDSVAFSHDSMLIASGSRDKTVCIWRTDTGWCIRRLIGHSSWIYSVVFSYNSVLVASASWDKTVRIWRTNTGECLQQLEGYGSLTTLAFSPNSALIALASQGRVRIWHTDTGACVQEVKTPIICGINSVAFSHDLALVAWALVDGTVQICYTDTGECVQELVGHSDEVQSVAFSHDSAFVASASRDRTIRIWSTEAGEGVQELTGESGWVNSLTFSHNSMLVVSGSCDNMVRIWRTDAGEYVQDAKGHSGEVNSVAFSHDLALVASSSTDNTTRIWCMNTRECIQELEGHNYEVLSVAFSHDSALVVSGSWGETLIWHTDTGQCIHKLEGHRTRVNSVAFSHDSTLVASGSCDNTARIWCTNTGECVQELNGHSKSVRSVAFSHNSALVASASWDGTVRIWRIDTGVCIQKLNGQIELALISVAFSHNSALIASASEEGTIQVWRADTSECIQEVDVGLAIYWLSFESDVSLLTSVGAIGLRNPQASGETPAGTASVTQTIFNAGRGYHSGYGFSRDLAWITWHGRDLLWLPVQFRPVCSAVSAFTVLIGCNSGRVIFIRFSTQKLPRVYCSIDVPSLVDHGDVDERRETALQRPDTSVLPRTD